MTRTRYRSRPAGERGMTLVELLIVIIILGILLTVAIAGLLRARVSSNEASAIASLRAIYGAQFSYTAGCGRGNYATTLLDLTIAPPGGREGYLSPDLGGSNTQTRYCAFSAPVVPGNTGTRAFAITQAGAVWEAPGAASPTEPFGPPAQTVK